MLRIRPLRFQTQQELEAVSKRVNGLQTFNSRWQLQQRREGENKMAEEANANKEGGRVRPVIISL
jgi:hypothetical protein